MTLAVVGTLFNTFAVGLSLYGFGCLYGNFTVEDHFDPCQVNSLQKGKSRMCKDYGGHTFNFILKKFLNQSDFASAINVKWFV